MEKKSHKLKFQLEYEFKLIGISSHVSDYKISWALNSKLNFEFKRIDDYKITSQSMVQSFSMYEFDDDEKLSNYILISNSSEKGYLIEEHKNIDYFLKISGDISNDELNEINKNLKSLDIVNASFIIDAETLKSKQKLLF